MSLEISGKLVKKMPEQTGEGRNGTWKKREFVIETEGQYPQKICIATWGDKVELVDKLNSKSCTGVIPLNNGTDHLLAQPHIPIIVRQWNELHPDKPMIQADFGVYSKKSTD